MNFDVSFSPDSPNSGATLITDGDLRFHQFSGLHPLSCTGLEEAWVTGTGGSGRHGGGSTPTTPAYSHGGGLGCLLPRGGPGGGGLRGDGGGGGSEGRWRCRTALWGRCRPVVGWWSWGSCSGRPRNHKEQYKYNNEI